MPLVLPSGLEVEIASNETLVRFLTSESQFNSTAVKPSAFLPGQDHETSVFRHLGQPQIELWEIAAQHIESQERRARGAAIITATAIRAVLLAVEASEPPARHAAIRGWHRSADPEAQKSKRKEAALELVRHALLIRRG